MIFSPLESYTKSTTDWRFCGFLTFMSWGYVTLRCKYFFLKAAQEKSVEGKKKGLMFAPSQMSRAIKTYQAPRLLKSWAASVCWTTSSGSLGWKTKVVFVRNQLLTEFLFFSLPALLSPFLLKVQPLFNQNHQSRFHTCMLLPYIRLAWRQKGHHNLKIDGSAQRCLWWADAAEGNN